MSPLDPNAARIRKERLETASTALDIGRLGRHIFLCAEQTNALCSEYEESREVWRHLKRRLKELNLASAPAKQLPGKFDSSLPDTSVDGGPVLRSKVDCLRICEYGPIAVVYPDGVWYRGVTVAVMDQIIDEHLVGGLPVEEYVFAVDELGR